MFARRYASILIVSITPPPQPGWFPNPSDPSKELFWDGKTWHDIQRNPVAAPAPSDPDPPAPSEPEEQVPPTPADPEEPPHRPFPKAPPRPPEKKRLGCGGGCLVIVGAIVLIFIVIGIVGAVSSSSSKGDDAQAVTYCEKRVRESLKSPSTANFTYPNVSGSSPNFVVTGVVDSENSFGGTVRSEYQCKIEFDGKGGYYTTLNYLR